MAKKVVIKRGAGLISVQVWTDKLPGRPFPAYAVLVDIKDDGSIMTYSGAQAHRKSVIASFKRTNK